MTEVYRLTCLIIYMRVYAHWFAIPKRYIQHMHKPNHRLLVVHCIEPPAVPSRDSWAELSQKEREKTNLIEDKYVQKMKDAGLSGKVISDFGRPGEMIVDVANREKASFIVIGTRGMGQLRRTIMGSVSDYVVHHASCPVLVCRHHKHSH